MIAVITQRVSGSVTTCSSVHMARRSSSPEILGMAWASSCHHKHYVGDKKNGKTFKNLGAQPQTGGLGPGPSVEPRLHMVTE